MKLIVRRRIATVLQRGMIFAAVGVLLPSSLFVIANQPAYATGDVPFVVSSEAGSHALAIGDEFICGIASDELAYCWGQSSQGLGTLGNGKVSSISVMPSLVDRSGVLADKTIKAISAGSDHTCVIASDGQAYCWGNNQEGGLGNDSIGNLSAVPVAVDTSGALAGKTLKAISAGNSHTCVIASDNQAYCWGYNGDGQLGSGTASSSFSLPVAVDTSGALAGKTLKAISAGSNHTCVIASDDKAYCWGYGRTGQLGDTGSGSSSASPVAVDTSGALADKTIKAISAGGYHTCAIASDDQAYCWGDSQQGQLGIGVSNMSSIPPTAVDTSGVLSGKSLTAISAGDSTTCAIASDAHAYCWGSNWRNLLGDGSDSEQSTVPVAVDTSGVLAGEDLTIPYSAAAASCALSTSQLVYCWGNNGPYMTQKVFDPTKTSLPPTQIIYSFESSSTVVENVSFSDRNGKKVAIIDGVGFGTFTDALTRSLVTLNGVDLPMCIPSSTSSAEEFSNQFGVPIELVADRPVCYLISDPDTNELLYTDTSTLIWLPSNFDISASGTVSVNGSEPFAFNQSTPPGDDDVTPTAGANGKSLTHKPTIEPRPTFSGKATPFSTVVVTVHSDPVTCTTTADSNGNWSCTLAANLPAGTHTVYVQVTSPTHVVTNLGPYEVTVDGQSPTVLAPNTGFFVHALHTTPAPRQQQGAASSSLLWAAMGMGASLSLLIAVVVYSTRQKRIFNK